MTPQLISAHSVSAFIVAIVSCLHPAVAADNQRPNFVVIYTDDLQHGVTGFTGHPRGQLTPVLDAAAASGTVFTDAHVVYALCGPSRAALLSGKYGSRNGMMDFQTRMKPQPTFVSRLRDDGYQTNVVGKWHINLTPEQAGFQTWTTFHGNGPYYNRTVNDNGTDRTAHKLIDEFCTDVSTGFLRRAAETNSPFLLLHATQLPHMDGQRKWPARPESLGRISPGSVTLPRNWNDDLAGKPPYLSTVRNRRVAFEEYGYQNPEKLRQHTQQYHAVTTEMDSALAPLFATLRETELDRNTYVFMMSDNGWMMGEHGMTSKMLAYEACTRVPFFVSGPGIRSARCDELVLNIDIAPTVLDIAGLPVPERMQGRSLVPLLNLKAEDLPIRHVQPDSRVSQNSQPWREVFVYEGLGKYADIKPHLAAVSRTSRLIQTFESLDAADVIFEELYDRTQDADELRNQIQEPAREAQINTLRSAIRQHLLNRKSGN